MTCGQAETERQQQNMEDGVDAAEQLMNALLSKKRPLSFESTVCDSRQFVVRKKKRPALQLSKAVRFAKEKRVHAMRETDDDDFPNCCWYQEQDYERIKQDNRETLVALSKANGKIATIDATEHCIRGLEVHINVLLLQIPFGNHQRKVVQSVLSLQQTQRKMQSHDAVALREMSLIISKQDKLKAWKVATIDAL